MCYWYENFRISCTGEPLRLPGLIDFNMEITQITIAWRCNNRWCEFCCPEFFCSQQHAVGFLKSQISTYLSPTIHTHCQINGRSLRVSLDNQGTESNNTSLDASILQQDFKMSKRCWNNDFWNLLSLPVFFRSVTLILLGIGWIVFLYFHGYDYELCHSVLVSLKTNNLF